MPDSRNNSRSESGSLVGAEPVQPTDPNKEIGKHTVESILLQDNRLGNETQEIFALATKVPQSIMRTH